MRNMSFFLTTEQILNQTKTVTRRMGWYFLKPGDIIMACVKCQGLKKGEKIEKICQLKILNTRREHLSEITKDDCIKEGFPEMSHYDFTSMFIKFNKLKSYNDCYVNRIEFEYLNPNA